MSTAANSSALPDSCADHHCYSFGDCVLDTDRAALLRDGVVVTLRPKSTDVLRYLATHPGRLLGKEEILRAVWPGVVVTEDSLTQCLIEIRRALGDTSRSIVRTVHGRGYILETPVVETLSGESTKTTAGPAAPDPTRYRGRSLAPIPVRTALATVLGLFALLAGYFFYDSTGDRHSSKPYSIAVLAFDDMSPAGDQQYLGDGMAEEILNQLAQSRQLRVVARTSSFSFKGEAADIPSIVNRLAVSHILEGSVRKQGDSVRVTAQLVAAADGHQLWSRSYDRNLDDVLGVQAEIAAAVADALAVTLQVSSPAVTPETRNGAGFQQYLLAKFLYARRGPGDVAQALAGYRSALELDDRIAGAWVGIAGCLGTQSFEGEIPAESALAQREMALENALRLDPNNAEAYARLVHVYGERGDIAAMEGALEKALALGRNSDLAQSIGSSYWSLRGDREQAVALQRRAVDLDPLGFPNRTTLAHMLFENGQFDEAQQQFAIAASLSPTRKAAMQARRAALLLLLHRDGEAEQLLADQPPSLYSDRALAMFHHRSGHTAAASAAEQRIRERVESAGDSQLPQDIDTGLALLETYAFRGDPDAAFELLYRLSAAGLSGNSSAVLDWDYLIKFLHSPWLTSLHDDPRWTDWRSAVERRLTRAGFPR